MRRLGGMVVGRLLVVIGPAIVIMVTIPGVAGDFQVLMIVIVVEMHLPRQFCRRVLHAKGVLGAIDRCHRHLGQDNGHKRHAGHDDDVPHPALEAMQHQMEGLPIRQAVVRRIARSKGLSRT